MMNKIAVKILTVGLRVSGNEELGGGWLPSYPFRFLKRGLGLPVFN